jgi:hypothetical protein
MLCEKHNQDRTERISFRDILFDGNNWEEYKEIYHPPYYVIGAVEKLRKCRTGELGYHFWYCEECGFGGKSPHTCKGKLCSSCATMATNNWLAEVLPTLLDIKYFQIVFTLPPDLYPIFTRNKKELYNLFFKTAADTLLLVAASLSFEPGLVIVFHPFGSEYNTHPHLHCMVTAGGLTLNHKGWFPVKFWPLEKTRETFKSLLYKRLRKLVAKNKVCNPHGSFKAFNEVITPLYLQNWNLHISYKDQGGKARFGLSYISRYAKRAIIADRNLLYYDGNLVVFKSKNKEITLPKTEFIARVLKHVLPKYFKTTRFYGIYSNKKKKTLVPLAKALADLQGIKPPREKQSWRERRKKYSGKDPLLCPICGHELTLIEVTYSSRIPEKWKGILDLSIFDHFL